MQNIPMLSCGRNVYDENLRSSERIYKISTDSHCLSDHFRYIRYDFILLLYIKIKIYVLFILILSLYREIASDIRMSDFFSKVYYARPPNLFCITRPLVIFFFKLLLLHLENKGIIIIIGCLSSFILAWDS